MTASASAAGKPPPSPDATLQPANSGASHVHKQQQQQQQQTSQLSLPKGQTETSPIQQMVDVHPLQAEPQQPAATSTQEGTKDSHKPGTSDGVQAQDQDLGTCAQARDGEGMSGGAAFGAWASAEQHSEWRVMEWVASEALPALIGAVRMVGPHTETEALRYLACLFVFEFCCLSVCLSVCPSVCLSACLSIHLSIRVSASLSVYLYVCHVFVPVCSCLLSCRAVCLSWALTTNWRPIDSCSCCHIYTERQNATLCRRLRL